MRNRVRALTAAAGFRVPAFAEATAGKPGSGFSMKQCARRAASARIRKTPCESGTGSRQRSFRNSPFSILHSEVSAFTLLEVLVVVATIALLVAILIPSLSSARAQARRAVCLSNLKQIAVAWHLYLEDSKGQFPIGMNVNVNYGGRQGEGSDSFGSDPQHPIPKPLNRYLKLASILRIGGEAFVCPADKGLEGVRPTAHEYYGTSYYPNDLLIGRQLWTAFGLPCQDAWAKLVGDPWAWPKPIPGMLDQVTRSAAESTPNLILIGDFTWYDNWDPTVPDRFPYWHRIKGKHNLAFLDGHADYVLIHKGIYVDAWYTVIPFRKIADEIRECQQEVPCP
jgi:prepilin-type processing-associated H-X9-DG protein